MTYSTVILLTQLSAVLNCIRVLGGHTHADSVKTMFDTDSFIESNYVEEIHKNSGNLALSLNWLATWSLKLVSLTNLTLRRYDSFKASYLCPMIFIF